LTSAGDSSDGSGDLPQNFAARPGWGGGDPWPDPPFVQKGLVDLAGNPKPAFGVVQSIYRASTQIPTAASTQIAAAASVRGDRRVR
jgi:hypothetical protein